MILPAIGILLVAAVGAFYISTDNLLQFGGRPNGNRMDRIRRSSAFNGEKFANVGDSALVQFEKNMGKMLTRWLCEKGERRPESDLPIVRLDKSSFADAPVGGLRVTWLGHATFLIEIDGKRILADPVWSNRVSPSSLVGPARFHPVPIAIDDLPRLDGVIISHDHFDHLDKETVENLAKTGVRFYVPLGVGTHLLKWGVSLDQIREFDWWEGTTEIEGLTLVATPARHFSGRGVSDRNSTLWSSWVISGPKHRVYFGGDSGMFDGYTEIGRKYGPFDVNLLPIGAYADFGGDRGMWKAIHLNPEEAITANRMLGGGLLIPTHWGTFNLAFHDWFEPANRLVKAANASGVTVAIPRPGQLVIPSTPPVVEHWWNPAVTVR